MTLHKLRPQLSDYFESIIGQTIDGVGTEEGDLIIHLSNGTELCIWSDDSLNITVTEVTLHT